MKKILAIMVILSSVLLVVNSYDAIEDDPEGTTVDNRKWKKREEDCYEWVESGITGGKYIRGRVLMCSQGQEVVSCTDGKCWTKQL